MRIKTILFAISLFAVLVACAPEPKQKAIDYYFDIRYERTSELIMRLDGHNGIITSYMHDPGRLTAGPSTKEYEALISEQKGLVSELKKQIKSLSKIESLGDDSEFLETMLSYLKKRLKFEETAGIKIVRLLKDGMTPDESSSLHGNVVALMEMQKAKKRFNEAEAAFLQEFKISDKDIEDMIAEH